MTTLPQPARYLPFANGRYDVKTGLSKLGTDFGNGTTDGRVFQIDQHWEPYRQKKLTARAADLCRHVCAQDLDQLLERRLVAYLIDRYSREHPQYFHLLQNGNRTVLHCELSGDTLYFDQQYRLSAADTHTVPRYVSALDALACQVQEDFALLRARPASALCWLHVCFPNHWAPTDKIGKDFVAIHTPVPGMDRINRQSSRLLAVLSSHGPHVRFAWGLASSNHLDRHPDAPGGREFSATRSLWIRVERQVAVPMAGQGFLFTIRTYMVPSHTLGREQVLRLEQAIASMPPESKRYKGITGSENEIFGALRCLAQ